MLPITKTSKKLPSCQHQITSLQTQHSEKAHDRSLPTTFSVDLVPAEVNSSEDLVGCKQRPVKNHKTTSCSQISSVTKPSIFPPSFSCIFNIDDVIDDTQDAVRELINTSAAIDQVMQVASDGIDAALDEKSEKISKKVR